MNVLIPPHSKKLNRQDCFNIAWKWAHDHDPCFTIVPPACLYRNKSNTNACLVGALIPDEILAKYNLTESTKGISTLIASTTGELLNLFDGDVNKDFLSELQRCHDKYYSSGNAKDKIIYALEVFAKNYNLIIPNDL